MKQKYFEDFCSLLETVAEQYNKKLSPDLKMLYWQGLHDVEYAMVKDALFKHIRSPDTSGKFMPKISDIRAMTEGSTEDSSLVAWTKFDKALRTTGVYRSVVFDDPLIQRVVQDMGGWIPFGSKTNEEWPFVANEFKARYKGFKSRSQTPNYPSHLIGMGEAYNANKGYRIDPPKLIGDIEKAKVVMGAGTGLIKFNDGVGLKPMQQDIESAVGSLKMLNN